MKSGMQSHIISGEYLQIYSDRTAKGFVTFWN